MKKSFFVLSILLLTCLYSFSVLAGKGNGAPSGPHYNLNIIGVENPKKADMTGSNRHTIFVPLKSTKTGNKSVKTNADGTVEPGTAIVDSKIWLAPGDTFRVCDGNGFDEAYGCSEQFDDDWDRCEFNENDEYVCLVTKKRGAVFELPCNNNVVSDGAEEFIGCDADDPQASYSVWARALGKPGGQAVATTCATVDKDLVCSTEQAVLTRDYGKSSFTDVTQELTSLFAYLCEVPLTELEDGSLICDDDGDLEADPDAVTLTRISLFAGDTQDWFWNYDNNGLRLAQLRFYPE
ncbi:MAG: hypothetical protein OET41_02450 [Xanthomonadales bacterium]|nr:hypothetical protein [Xanthomonadales bacterium]MDH3999836.1 hypothetical protein [Xanthomonadales bacterium]